MHIAEALDRLASTTSRQTPPAGNKAWSTPKSYRVSDPSVREERGRVAITWSNIRRRFQPGDWFLPLAGSSPLQVVRSSDRRIEVAHRFWHSPVTPRDLAIAKSLLDRSERSMTPLEFASHMRFHYASRPPHGYICPRTPNVMTALLANLGAFDDTGPA